VRNLVSLALVETVGISNAGRAEGVDEQIEAVCRELRGRWAETPPASIPLLGPARELYRSIGIDPTRRRPSSEALLRRILRGDPLPRINPAVDLANLWAVASGLSVGLYDVGKLRGERVEARLGLPGESYAGIRKGEINCENRLVLADDEGAFGNPTSDSLRTSVTGATSHCLFVMFAPSSYDVGMLDRWAAWLRERALASIGGDARSAVLP
jgi:DNA/RNA-binding domain of Phe-tRNA-synthetase-like protein